MPRAIKLKFWRILFFYNFSVLLIGMLAPLNLQRLSFATKQSTGASASPFVVAIIGSGIRVLPGLINACISIFVFSATNSDLYVATRVLYSLAKEGKSHRIFAHTDSRGVPIYALGLSSLITCIAFLNVDNDSRVVFGYFVSLVTLFGLLTWTSILVGHIHFVYARRAQDVREQDMAYIAPLGLYGTYLALVFCIIIAVFSNFRAFVHVPTKNPPNFDYKTFITGYLGIPLYLIMIFGYKPVMRSTGKTALDADIFTGKDIIDREKQEFLSHKYELSEKQPQNRFYKLFIVWLF